MAEITQRSSAFREQHAGDRLAADHIVFVGASRRRLHRDVAERMVAEVLSLLEPRAQRGDAGVHLVLHVQLALVHETHRGDLVRLHRCRQSGEEVGPMLERLVAAEREIVERDGRDGTSVLGGSGPRGEQRNDGGSDPDCLVVDSCVIITKHLVEPPTHAHGSYLPMPPADPGERVVSLDTFRGLTIAAMILVNNPGTGTTSTGRSTMPPWHGWTPTDLIFPFFLFMVGMSLHFSRSRASAPRCAARRSSSGSVSSGRLSVLRPRDARASPACCSGSPLCYLAAWLVIRHAWARRAGGPRGRAARRLLVR